MRSNFSCLLTCYVVANVRFWNLCTCVATCNNTKRIDLVLVVFKFWNKKQSWFLCKPVSLTEQPRIRWWIASPSCCTKHNQHCLAWMWATSRRVLRAKQDTRTSTLLHVQSPCYLMQNHIEFFLLNVRESAAREQSGYFARQPSHRLKFKTIRPLSHHYTSCIIIQLTIFFFYAQVKLLWVSL